MSMLLDLSTIVLFICKFPLQLEINLLSISGICKSMKHIDRTLHSTYNMK